MQPTDSREALAQQDSDADGKDDQRRYGKGQRKKCRRVAGHPLSFFRLAHPMRRRAPRRRLDEFCEGYRQAAPALKEKPKIPPLLGTDQEKGVRDSCGGLAAAFAAATIRICHICFYCMISYPVP